MKTMSVKEYADLMNVSEKTIRKKIREGKIKAVKEIINKREVTRILPDDQNVTIEPTTEPLEPFEIAEQTPYRTQSQEFNIIDKLTDKLTHYAGMAGKAEMLMNQTKMLETSESNTKQICLELQQQNTMHLQEIARLEERIKSKDEKIESLELYIDTLKEKNSLLEAKNNQIEEKKGTNPRGSFWSKLIGG